MKTRLEQKFPFTILIAGIMSLMVTPASAQLLTAFNNFYAAVPGTIECEQFDHGGQGYAYSVLTNVNLGGKYRTDGVSIYTNSTVNGGLGYCIGNTWPTEWFSYLTTISETTVYRIEVRARTATNGQYSTTFHLNWNGTANVSGTMTVPNDGAWHTVSGTTPAALTATTAPLQLAIENGDPNVGCGYFDYITIYKVPPSASPGPNSFTISSLSTTWSYSAATNNASIIQNAINRLGSSGGTVTLPAGGPYYVCQVNPQESFITGAGNPQIPHWCAAPLCASRPNSSTTRQDYTGYVGFAFTNGITPMVVTHLGRWVLSGNGQSHNLVLTDANGYVQAQTTLALSGQPVGQFVYAPLPSPFTLSANTKYAVMSQETGGVGNDAWYDVSATTTVINTNVASGPTGCYTSTTNSGLSYYGTGSYVPVSLVYSNAIPGQPNYNYAVWIGQNNVTVQGNATSGTTLQALNRGTTIFWIGGANDGTPSLASVANVTLTNITFVGSPPYDWAGFYNPTGVVSWTGLSTNFNPIGTLVACSGAQYYDPSIQRNVTNWSANLIITNCIFYNPSAGGVGLWWAKDVDIEHSAFSYFNGTNGVPMPASLVTNLEAWCGIFSQAQLVQDVRVAANSFNGNMSMQSVTDYAADGLLWLSRGGQFSVEGNSLTNYHFEAVQLDSGPYTVVGNIFNTTSTCPSSCALCTFQDFNTSSISSPASINSTYCFVANTINGTGGGWGIRNQGDRGYGPFNILASANQFSEFMYPSGSGPSETIGLSTCQNASITGNQLVQGERAACYQDGPYAASTQPCGIYALCNDFSAATLSSFFVQDGNNKLSWAEFVANRLGHGYEQHFALYCATNSPPTITVSGNEFWPILVGQPNLAGAGTANNVQGSVGCAFTVGSTPLTTTHLGRWVLSGNTASHTLQMYDVYGNPINGWSVAVSTSGQPAGQYGYGALANSGSFTPITLQANTTYILTSSESNGGDWFYASGTCSQIPTVTASGCTVIEPILYQQGYGWYVPCLGSRSDGPVSLIDSEFWPPYYPWPINGNTYNLVTGVLNNQTYGYYINSPNDFANASFSLF